MCRSVSFLLYLNNSTERCRLRQLSEFHLQSLPKILELCRLAGYVLGCPLVSDGKLALLCTCNGRHYVFALSFGFLLIIFKFLFLWNWSRPGSKLGEEQPLHGRNWGQISGRSVEQFWMQRILPLLHFVLYNLIPKFGSLNFSANQTYGAGLPHVGLCPKFLVYYFHYYNFISLISVIVRETGSVWCMHRWSYSVLSWVSTDIRLTQPGHPCLGLIVTATAGEEALSSVKQ